MPKFSETPDEVKQGHINFINTTTDRFLKEFQDANLRALKYLMFVNAGGAIATASVIAGTSRFDGAIVVALAFFIFGIILAGIVTAFGYEGSNRALFTWLPNLERFYADEITWEDLLKKTKESFSESFLIWDRIVGYGSFLFFIGGCIIAAYALLGFGSPSVEVQP